MDNTKDSIDEKRKWAYEFSREKGERDYYAFLAQARSEGYAEGLAIAKEMNREAAAKSLIYKLKQHFGAVGPEQENQIFSASKEQLELWTEQYLGFSCIDELLESN